MKNAILITLIVFSNLLIAQTIKYELVVPLPPRPPNVSEFIPTYQGDVVFADVDGDGDLDLVIAGYSGAIIQYNTKLYINDGNGDYTEKTGTPFIGVDECSIAFADVDGDNDQDLLVTGSAGGPKIAKLYINDGNGNFTEKIGTPFTGVSYSAAMFADIDNDGDLDVLITGYVASGLSKIYKNDGAGNFTHTSSLVGVLDGDVAFADIDGDGDLDVLISGQSNAGYVTKLYTNNGSGGFSLVAGTSFIPASAFDFTDVDGDGDQDVVLVGASWFGANSALYINNGSGVFTPKASFPTGLRGSGTDVAFADVDNDGDQDLLIEDAGSIPKIKLFSNDGNGNFSIVSNLPFSEFSESAFAFADIDGDRDFDVIILGHDGSYNPITKLYRNITTCCDCCNGSK